MKKLISLFLIFSLTTHAAPPTGVGSQSSSTLNYSNNTIAPYRQATKLAGVNTLIETGSENMLANPGFEASTLSGWTCTVGTCSKTSTSGEFSSGLAAMKVVLSAQSMNVSQTINTPSGIQKQGYFRILYRIPATGIVTPTMTITVDSVLQTTVPSTSLIMDGTFRQIEVPLIFGSTNVKVSLLSGSSTGTVFFDAAIVAQGLGTQNLMLDNVYSAELSGSCAVTFENKDWILSTTNPSTGQCNVTFVSNLVNQQMNCTTTTRAALSAITTNIASPSSTGFLTYSQNTNTGAATATTFGVICQKSGNDYLASSANVYSQNSANYNETLYTPVTTGFGTISPATNACTHKRVLGDLEVKCSFLTGTTTATFGTIKLPLSLSVDPSRLITGSNTNLQQGTMVGDFSVSSANVNGRMVTAAGTDATLVYIAGNFVGAATTAPQTSTSGAIGNNLAVNISFKVPIAGWSNSNVIVGSFEKIEKCTGTTECVDVFSARITTTSGAVVNSSVSPNWLSCTAANPTLCTFTAGIFTVAPNCVASSTDSGTNININLGPATSTSVLVGSYLGGGGGLSASRVFDLYCQKTGVDSKPKTAKIASSIGVPTVPGVTTEAIDTFSVSYGTTNATTNCTVSPCSYLDQIGSAVSTITRSSTGAYILNTLKTYANLKCTGVARSSTGAFENFLGGSCVSSSSCAFSTGVSDLGTTRDTNGTLMCQGSY